MPKKSSKSKKPLVSIILQTKNEQGTIGKLLKVLTTQIFKNFEIILADDNSTDKTLKIVDSFSKKLPIEILKIKPGEFNYSYVLNLGASKSKGKYLCSLVGHSLPMSNDWLENGLTNFKDPRVAGISGYYTEKSVGYFSRSLGKLLFNFGLLFNKEKREKIIFDPWMTSTNSIIRKDLWQEYPFDEKLVEGCEDYDWACEMLARGYNIIKDPKFSVFHSHRFIGRPEYHERLPRWKKICAMIDKRKRPRKSYTRLKI